MYDNNINRIRVRFPIFVINTRFLCAFPNRLYRYYAIIIIHTVGNAYARISIYKPHAIIDTALVPLTFINGLRSHVFEAKKINI